MNKKQSKNFINPTYLAEFDWKKVESGRSQVQRGIFLSKVNRNLPIIPNATKSLARVFFTKSFKYGLTSKYFEVESIRVISVDNNLTEYFGNYGSYKIVDFNNFFPSVINQVRTFDGVCKKMFDYLLTLMNQRIKSRNYTYESFESLFSHHRFIVNSNFLLKAVQLMTTFDEGQMDIDFCLSCNKGTFYVDDVKIINGLPFTRIKCRHCEKKLVTEKSESEFGDYISHIDYVMILRRIMGKYFLSDTVLSINKIVSDSGRMKKIKVESVQFEITNKDMARIVNTSNIANFGIILMDEFFNAFVALDNVNFMFNFLSVGESSRMEKILRAETENIGNDDGKNGIPKEMTTIVKMEFGETKIQKYK